MGSGDITSIIQSIGNISDQLAVQLVMGYLDTIGFFSLPIINQITEFLISHLIDLLTNKLEIVTINLISIIQTANQESAFYQAAQANAEAQINGKNQSETQANLISAARSFYKFAPP